MNRLFFVINERLSILFRFQLKSVLKALIIFSSVKSLLLLNRDTQKKTHTEGEKKKKPGRINTINEMSRKFLLSGKFKDKYTLQ